jgi:precorrin-4/cobalt-precorrin-4 C11-methyltransferase
VGRSETGKSMTVHFVGAGPGAADLLTLRAAALLAAADVVLYPGTYLDADVLGHCQSGARLVDTQDLDLDQMTAVMVEAHHAGHEIVRLTSGDPSLYSALHEQTRRLDAAGVPWDVTPGVPAYAAAAARVGAELTVPELVQSVVLTRVQARSTAMPDSEALANFAATGATLALHLAITRTRELAAELARHYGDDCPVVVVSRVSQPEELILRGTLATIAAEVESAGLRQAAVIIVSRALGRGSAEAESFLYSADRDRSAKRRSP